MKKLDNLIPLAFTAIKDSGIVKNGEINKEYKGYIASFGASVIQSGLLAAVTFYSQNSENSQSKSDRPALMEVLFKMVKSIRKDEVTEKSTLLEYVKDNENNILRKQVLDAATAIKLVIRTYKISENGKS